MVTTKKKSLIFFAIVILINTIFLVSALDTCSDTNEIDVSEIPCNGLTPVVSCTGNVTAINLNTSVQTNITTSAFAGGRLNFTFNLTNGSYSLIDCQNFSATVIVGFFKQGYGTSSLAIIIPAISLAFIILFISSRMNRKLNLDDEERKNNCKGKEARENSKFIPTLFLIFSFVPMVFMVRFVESYLQRYLGGSGIADFYGAFYIFYAYLFWFIFIIMIVVWSSKYIKRYKVTRGLSLIE